MNHARMFAALLVEALVHLERDALLRLSRWRGVVRRHTSRGWGPVVRWLVTVSLALLLVPYALDGLLDLVPDGVWKELAHHDGPPAAGEWWSVRNVLLVSAAVLALRWLVRARERVVVEEFVDYTNKDAQAVKGLATLLVAELSRLRELY